MTNEFNIRKGFSYYAEVGVTVVLGTGSGTPFDMTGGTVTFTVYDTAGGHTFTCSLKATDTVKIELLPSETDSLSVGSNRCVLQVAMPSGQKYALTNKDARAIVI